MNRKPETISFWIGRLPHWEVEDARYFITIHLAGAIPQRGKNEIRATVEQLRNVETRESPDWLRLQRLIFHQMERWLDRTGRMNWLHEREVAEMVMEAIAHRQASSDWHVFEYVVMPTHIHLFCEIGKHGLKGTLEDFKRWTGHQAIKLLRPPPDRFWQREWFDHWSRSDEQDDQIVAYIRNNPVKAGFVTEYSDWPYGSWNQNYFGHGSKQAIFG